MNNSDNSKLPKPYLKKGGGKLASDYHGETEFAKKRLAKIITEQEDREKRGYDPDYIYKLK